MTHRSELSLFVRLVQTILISGAGFLLVSLLGHSTMSRGWLLIGPAAVALMILGLKDPENLLETRTNRRA